MSLPFVSVIIPCFNDAEHLEDCLTCISNQTYPADRFEVIVVDNSPSLSLPTTNKKQINFRIIHEPHPGSYAARNKGGAAAIGEVLAFTDADCSPCKNWLKTGVEALMSRPECGLVGGDVRNEFIKNKHPNLFEIYQDIHYSNQMLYVERDRFAATANAFVWKFIFDESGGFNSKLLSAGDYEFGRRVNGLGHLVIYSKEAYVLHRPKKTLREMVRKVRRIEGGIFMLQRMGLIQNTEVSKRRFKILHQVTQYFDWKTKTKLNNTLAYDQLNQSIRKQIGYMSISVLFLAVRFFERIRLMTRREAHR